MISWWLFD